MVKCLIIYRIKKHPMSRDSLDDSIGAPHGASHGAPHVLVPISSFIETDGSPPVPVANPLSSLQRKFGLTACFLCLVEILVLIIALSLWQTGNEAAGIVVLCVGYFSTYFLVVLGMFLDTETLNLRLQLKFTVLKFLLILQLACIYLQRAIVPDLWIFAISYVIFLIMSVVVIKACWKIYKEDNTKKLFLLTLSIFVCVVVISQTVYFGLYANAYSTTTLVQTKLPMGALFVSILFGQMSSIVMIVMTKIWKVKPEVSRTSV